MAGLSAATLVVALAPVTAAQAATTAAAGVQVRIAHSGKCLNVQGNSSANLAKIVQYTCYSSVLNDKFKIVPRGDGAYWIQGVGSGKCLNVQGGSTANNAGIIQYTCGNQLNTLWYVEEVIDKPTVRFISANSGKCLNLPRASTTDNTQLIQYSCTASGAANEQFFMPPTASGTAVRRPFTAKQPIAVRQEAPSTGGALGPVSFSWISADNELTILTDPDPSGSHPGSPGPVAVQTDSYGFTGRPAAAGLQDGRTQVVAHDAAAGDVVLADEAGLATGDYYLGDIGGAIASQPTVGHLAPGRLAVYATVGGALWYAPEAANNPQTPYGAWRSLGGTGLSGTPAVVQTAEGARIFVLNTAGQIQTATLVGTTLSDWTNLGGTGLSGTPSAVVVTGYESLVFARSSTGTVVYKKQNTDGTFPADWTPIPGLTITGSPSAAFDEFRGQVVVAARGTDSLISFAYETGPLSGQFGPWVQVSDPANHPESVGASDPTAFGYDDTTSGGVRGFGIAFQSVDDLDVPFVAFYDTQTALTGKSAAPKGELRKLSKPSKITRLK